MLANFKAGEIVRLKRDELLIISEKHGIYTVQDRFGQLYFYDEHVECVKVESNEVSLPDNDKKPKEVG